MFGPAAGLRAPRAVVKKSLREAMHGASGHDDEHGHGDGHGHGSSADEAEHDTERGIQHGQSHRREEREGLLDHVKASPGGSPGSGQKVSPGAGHKSSPGSGPLGGSTEPLTHRPASLGMRRNSFSFLSDAGSVHGSLHGSDLGDKKGSTHGSDHGEPIRRLSIGSNGEPTRRPSIGALGILLGIMLPRRNSHNSLGSLAGSGGHEKPPNRHLARKLSTTSGKERGRSGKHG